jgi:4,5-dihydroxyphthalate decarboxylase
MANLQLTFAAALYDRLQPIYTGEVKPDGIDLNFIRIEQPRPIFDRMSGGEEFDVAEYSSSEFVQRYANKKCNFVAIPVFPSRTFRHSHIGVNKKIISKPKDLEGKRIGVALYTMTAAIFIRGILQHDHGVDFSKVTWVQGAINAKGAHGSPTVLPLLKPVKIEQGPANKSLDDLLQEGVVDATIGTSMPESFRTNPKIGRLFPDFVERERDHYKRTKIFPIMHLVAIKKSVYEKYPFVATSLYNAFQKAKEIALERMFNERALRYMLPWLPRDIDEIHEYFGGDPWPYGVEENRPTLEALVQYLQDQHLTDWKPTLEELFAPNWGATHY